jgi:ribonuclease BN (tRNA processing enzyme)
MRLTVLGGCGAWPEAGRACSGYLLEHDGFRLLIDPGYATLPKLLTIAGAEQVDAVFVSHGHPDHCADLNPLLRARVLRDVPAPSLPVYALQGALDAVLALDRPGMLDGAYDLRSPGPAFDIGPFTARTSRLPHWEPNLGIRLSAGGESFAYTGDSGPSPAVIALARDVDLFLADASFADEAPPDARANLGSARLAGSQAAAAGVGRLLLTHLLPGADPAVALDRAAREYRGEIAIAGA